MREGSLSRRIATAKAVESIITPTKKILTDSVRQIAQTRPKEDSRSELPATSPDVERLQSARREWKSRAPRGGEGESFTRAEDKPFMTGGNQANRSTRGGPDPTMRPGSFDRAQFLSSVAQIHERKLSAEDFTADTDEEVLLAQVERARWPIPEVVIFPEGRSKTGKDSRSGSNRESTDDLEPPPFPHLAFGVARFIEEDPVLDGDLSDWGKLEHPIRIRYQHDGRWIPNGEKVYLRWNARGLYIAYQARSGRHPGPNKRDAWGGHAMEVFLDARNHRQSVMQKSPTSHQFCLMPFGYRGKPETTFAEIGRGFRGRKEFETYTDASGREGRAVAAFENGGYTVEAMIRAEAISGHPLRAGLLMALNLSLNQGEGWDHHRQWAAPKSENTWNKPETWGDVLLVGPAASLSLVDPEDDSTPLERITIGQRLKIMVEDSSANRDPARRDRLIVETRREPADGAPSKRIALEETGENSGVFSGVVEIAPRFAEAEAGVVSASAGHELVFLVQQTPEGAPSMAIPVKQSILVSWPVLRFRSRNPQ